MKHRTPLLSRRTVLRGLGGTTVALPFLESMASAKTAAPKRFLMGFGAYSLITDNDPRPDRVVPDRTGYRFDLKDGLKPLAAVQDDITLVSGLEIPQITRKHQNMPVAGRGGPDFHWHNNPLLSGMRMTGEFEDTVTGPTPDQVFADAVGDQTRFRALAYAVQASPYLSGGRIETTVNHSVISHRRIADGRILPVLPQVSPRMAFDTLFAGVTPNDPVEAKRRALELRKNRSVLDLVDRSLSGLLGKMGGADKQRLQQHWDEVRTLEYQMSDAFPVPSGLCSEMRRPGEDPPIGGSISNPAGYDVNAGYSNEEARAQVMTDLLAMAFKCDLTRAASLMFTSWQSFMNSNPITGDSYTLHELNHKTKIENITAVIAWHMKHLARLVENLRSAPEGNGTVLDNSVVVFANEGGNGIDYEAAISQGEPPKRNSHSTQGMVMLVAGRAGGLQPGRHIVAPAHKKHPGNVLVAALNAAGVNTRTLGEVEDPMPGLRGALD